MDSSRALFGNRTDEIANNVLKYMLGVIADGGRPEAVIFAKVIKQEQQKLLPSPVRGDE